MTTSGHTHYGVLGVAASVSAHELKRAYRRMQRTSHPDTGGSAEQFRIVQDAWAALGTPDKRAAYDRALSAGSAHPSAAEPRVGPTSQTTRTPTRPSTAAERPRVRRADSHGHPGGSFRLKYRDLMIAWLVNPTPPSPPVPLVPARKARGRFLRHGLRLGAQMTTSFAAVGAGLVLFLAWRQGLLADGIAAIWLPLLLVAGFGGFAGAISSVPVSLLRMRRDSYRRELIRYAKEKAATFAAAQADFRRAHRAFEIDLRAWPSNTAPLLAAPYSKDAVRVAPPSIRVWLDRALAQESTARELASVGPRFSIWHDVELGAGHTRFDHLVVGPQGLIVIESMTEAGPVTVEHDSLRHGGRAVPDVRDTLRPRLADVGKALGIGGASATLLVYADSALVHSGLQQLGGGAMPTFVVGASHLAAALVQGLPGVNEGASWQLDRLRATLAERVRFA